MSTICENCMRWRDLQFKKCISNKTQFHAIAGEDVKTCMRIPQEQGSRFRENINEAETIKLYAPNGCIYDIEVCREMGEIVLRSGWDVFAAAYRIEENDFLVFEFGENLTFKVNIFSSHDGSQKTTSCVNPPSKMVEAVPPSFCDCDVPNDVPGAQEMSDDSVEIIEPPHKAANINCLSSSDEDNIVSAYAKSYRHQTGQLGHRAKIRRMASASSPSIKPGSGINAPDGLVALVKDRVNWVSFNSNNPDVPSCPPYIVLRNTILSEVQQRMVLKKVQAIQSEFPTYVAVMNRGNIGETGSSYMRFSKEYATKWLPLRTQALTLQLEGNKIKKWHTVLQVIGGQSHSRDERRIRGGWKKFASDNNLRLGDICLFEMLKATGRLEMIVYLIRKPV